MDIEKLTVASSSFLDFTAAERNPGESFAGTHVMRLDLQRPPKLRLGFVEQSQSPQNPADMLDRDRARESGRMKLPKPLQTR